jgi:hypothetical protein
MFMGSRPSAVAALASSMMDAARPLQRRILAYNAFALACAASLRRQSRHTQSSPPRGIGRRAVSSLHQHGPAGAQVNSVPHREQARRREG